MNLSASLEHPVFKTIGAVADELSVETYLVGGYVRDIFLQRTSKDIDFVCVGSGIELAEAVKPASARPAPGAAMQSVDTPQKHTIEDVSTFLKVPASQCVKTLLVEGTEKNSVVALVVRGDHELNVIKAEKHPLVAAPLTFATPEQVHAACGANIGSIGPVGLTVPLIVDHAAAQLADFVCGANVDEKHLTGVNWVRDLPEPASANYPRYLAGAQ